MQGLKPRISDSQERGSKEPLFHHHLKGRLAHTFVLFSKRCETMAVIVIEFPGLNRKVSRLCGSFHDPLRSKGQIN